MPFVDYTLLNNEYPTGQMAENVQLLHEFDIFHCLLAGSPERASKVTRRIADLPDDFIKWLGVCDGGMLFDTTMFTTKSLDAELDLEFVIYSDFHKPDIRKNLNIPDEWFVFAVAVHSDLFYFDMEKKDGQVYQWDIEDKLVYAEWKTFEDWLSDQVNEAIELIADEQLMPHISKVEIYNDEQ